jgi:RNase P protein component
VRVHLLQALPAIDIVIRARPSAYALTFDAIVTELADVRTAL